MYLRTLLILALIMALSVFAAINWHAFATPTNLSLAFTTVEAPLGLILLGFVALLTFLFLVYLVYLQSSALFEWRRHARELQAQRELAENAEASRFNQLQSLLQVESEKLAKQVEESRSAMSGRLEQIERELRTQIEQSANTLAAYIAELEDRVEEATGRQGPRRDRSE
jgi:uncharacterized integral membrane protein